MTAIAQLLVNPIVKIGLGETRNDHSVFYFASEGFAADRDEERATTYRRPATSPLLGAESIIHIPARDQHQDGSEHRQDPNRSSLA